MDAVNWLWNHQEELLAAVGAIGVACEGGALALLALARMLLPLAKLTKSLTDDRILGRIIRGLEVIAGAIPRLRTKPRSDDHGSGIGGVPMLCLALCFVAAGCHGGEVQDARSARTDYVLGAVESALLLTGQALVAPYEAKEAQCAAGPVGGYVACTDPWNKAIDSLSVAYHSTRAAREGLDAGRGAPVLPCIAGLLDEAVSAVDALGVELPAAVSSGMNAAQGLARLVAGECEVEP